MLDCVRAAIPRLTGGAPPPRPRRDCVASSAAAVVPPFAKRTGQSDNKPYNAQAHAQTSLVALWLSSALVRRVFLSLSSRLLQAHLGRLLVPVADLADPPKTCHADECREEGEARAGVEGGVETFVDRFERRRVLRARRASRKATRVSDGAARSDSELWTKRKSMGSVPRSGRRRARGVRLPPSSPGSARPC